MTYTIKPVRRKKSVARTGPNYRVGSRCGEQQARGTRLTSGFFRIQIALCYSHFVRRKPSPNAENSRYGSGFLAETRCVYK